MGKKAANSEQRRRFSYKRAEVACGFTITNCSNQLVRNVVADAHPFLPFTRSTVFVATSGPAIESPPLSIRDDL